MWSKDPNSDLSKNEHKHAKQPKGGQAR